MSERLPQRPLAPITQADRLQMAEAHAEGWHDEHPREGCPDCPGVNHG